MHIRRKLKTTLCRRHPYAPTYRFLTLIPQRNCLKTAAITGDDSNAQKLFCFLDLSLQIEINIAQQ